MIVSSYIEGVEPRIPYFLGKKATVASFEHTAVRAGQDL